MALLPYIGLNVIYCFPETWDLASGKTDVRDYSATALYQKMVQLCTISGMTSEVATFPHRQFFGIEDGQFTWRYNKPQLRDPRLNAIGRYPYGVLPIEEFLNCEVLTENKPGPSAIPQVQQMLYSKGLPMELVLDIMDMAEYAPRGRLQVPHDPFHPENREDLAKYLKYCWVLFVRCDMMATALGMVINWEELICDAMIQLFSATQSWYSRDPLNDSNIWVFS